MTKRPKDYYVPSTAPAAGQTLGLWTFSVGEATYSIYGPYREAVATARFIARLTDVDGGAIALARYAATGAVRRTA